MLWLEQHLKDYLGAILAVTHDRYFLDHVAEWICEVDRGRLYLYEGNYSTYLEKKQEQLKIQGKKDASLAKRLKDEPFRRVRVQREGLRPVEVASGPLRGDGRRGGPHAQVRLRGDPDPAGPAPGVDRPRGEGPGEGLRRPHLIDGCPSRCPATASSASSVRTASARRPLFKTIVGLEPLDGGDLKIGETVSISYVDQSRGGIDPKKTLWRSSPTAWTSSRSATSRCPRARTSRRSGSRA